MALMRGAGAVVRERGGRRLIRRRGGWLGTRVSAPRPSPVLRWQPEGHKADERRENWVGPSRRRRRPLVSYLVAWSKVGCAKFGGPARALLGPGKPTGSRWLPGLPG